MVVAVVCVGGGPVVGGTVEPSVVIVIVVDVVEVEDEVELDDDVELDDEVDFGQVVLVDVELVELVDVDVDGHHPDIPQ